MQSKADLHDIDKTAYLEEGIGRFPSIYIEGNAAVGKSAAVRMLLEKHTEILSLIFDVEKELKKPEKFQEKLIRAKQKMREEEFWLVLENMPKTLESSQVENFKEMIREICGEGRLIFVSRHKPQEELLELLWKNEMMLVPMEKLLLSREEVRSFIRQNESSWNADEIYEKLGGWAGCIAMLLKLEKEYGQPRRMEEYLHGYEMKAYVEKQMLSELNDEERTFLSFAACCPWINEKMLKDLWKVENRSEKLENLWRKGFLYYEDEKYRWKLSKVFQNYIEDCPGMFGEEYLWYEKNGYIAETILCLKKYSTKEVYRSYMLKYYEQIYSLGLLSEEVLGWSGKTPQECYLRGMYYYSIQRFDKLEKEIERLQRMPEKDLKTKEVLINLLYLNPQISLKGWMEAVTAVRASEEKYKLYQMLGNSVTYLCGIRDLSELFACSAKEEKQNAHFWKTCFGETEWKCYQLAKIDFYLETERLGAVLESDWNLLRDAGNEDELWQIRMAKLYLLCKVQRIRPDDMYIRKIKRLEKSLRNETYRGCADVAECISSLYAPWYGVREKMSKWLRYRLIDSSVAITEENYVVFYCRAKGYLMLNQFEQAEKILRKLLPYLMLYRRNRFLTEVYFQYAMINYGRGLKGQSIKNAIESFLLCTNSRYVRFYAGYGKKGQEVLESYAQWQKAAVPEGVRHKKKYNYGNVLHMPVEDYLDVVLRAAKKSSVHEKKFPEEYAAERLTMTETLILQDIGRGMSNGAICEELGIKLPTVKGHIYNLYKKLGVNNRGQAVLKGRELGILE